MPISCVLASSGPASTTHQIPAESPAKIPMPPTSGVADARHRLASGARSRPRASGDRRSAQTTAMAAGSATRATSVVTTVEGRATVLGLCVPAQRLPRLERDHDGVRRPPALPRALLEPLPPRLPGEVQGLAPRRLLVPPEPPRTARRLPARLRGHLSEPEDAALPAVPARGPRVLDLLRDVADRRGSLADRLGGAREEGALPAPARGVLDGGHTGSHALRHARRADRALPRLRRGRTRGGVARDSAQHRLRRVRRLPVPDRGLPQRALP